VTKVAVVSEYTAAELASKDIPEPVWIVPGLLPAGLSLLAGKPKIGKSWLTLAIAVGVSNGTQVLDRSVGAQGVLYLALEDNEQRLKTRLLELLGDDDKPSERLHFVNGWKSLAEGGLADLEARLAADPTIRLVVIDTLGRVRKSSKPGGNIYLEDYEIIAGLKAVADKFQAGILCVHHTRKAHSADPFETISGTTGLTGAADTNMVLSRMGIAETVLHVNGRDVEEQHLAMKFDDGAWEVLGPAAKFCISKSQQKIMTALKESQKGPTDIANATGLPLDSVKKDLKKLVGEGLLDHLDHGLYAHSSPPSL